MRTFKIIEIFVHYRNINEYQKTCTSEHIATSSLFYITTLFIEPFLLLRLMFSFKIYPLLKFHFQRSLLNYSLHLVSHSIMLFASLVPTPNSAQNNQKPNLFKSPLDFSPSPQFSFKLTLYLLSTRSFLY